MTTTTHIATSCLITVFTLGSGLNTLGQVIVAAVGSFCSHLLLDVIPHGFIAEPKTIFKKAVPTLLELVPGPVILLLMIRAYGNPLLFIWAAGCSILPDIATTLMWNNKELVSRIPGVSLIHRIHRLVHWFEKDNCDGTVSYLFPKHPLLALESFLIISLLIALFV
jgi:hypothetical protein